MNRITNKPLTACAASCVEARIQQGMLCTFTTSFFVIILSILLGGSA